MLYINDESYDKQAILTYRGSDPLYVFLQDKLNEILSGPQIIRFKYREGIIKSNSLQGLPEGKKTIISWDDMVQSNRGTEHWVWATNRRKVLSTGNYIYNSQPFIFTRILALDKDKDWDRILFLVCASSRLRSGLIVVENTESEAQARLLSTADKDMVKVTVLTMGLKQVRSIGSAFMIENTQSLSEFVLKETLLSRFDEMVKKGTKSYKEILGMLKSEEISKMRATVQKALDMGIIVYRNHTYGFADQEGKISEEIIPVPTKEEFQKEEILITFLEKNDIIFTRVLGEIKAVEGARNDLRNGSGGDGNGNVPEGSGINKSAQDPGVEKEEILNAIRSFVTEHGSLPFDEKNKEKVKELAVLCNIEKAGAGRTYVHVYQDLKNYFGVPA